MVACRHTPATKTQSHHRTTTHDNPSQPQNHILAGWRRHRHFGRPDPGSLQRSAAPRNQTRPHDPSSIPNKPNHEQSLRSVLPARPRLRRSRLAATECSIPNNKARPLHPSHKTQPQPPKCSSGLRCQRHFSRPDPGLLPLGAVSQTIRLVHYTLATIHNNKLNHMRSGWCCQCDLGCADPAWLPRGEA